MATIIVIDENSSNLKANYKEGKTRENLLKKGYRYLVEEIFLRCPSELVALIFIHGSQFHLVSALSTNKNDLIPAIENLGRDTKSDNSIQKCDVAQLFTYLITTVLHNAPISAPKKIIFFTDPHNLNNLRQALHVLDHSHRVHMIQFTTMKREDQTIEDARRLCGVTAGGFYLHRSNKDGYKVVHEAVNSICRAEYKEYKAQLYFGHVTSPITLLPNPHHVWKQVNEKSVANNGNQVPFLPDVVSILGFVQASHFKSLPELCRFSVVPYSLVYPKANATEVDPLCLMLNELFKSNSMFALLSLGPNWHGLLMHHVEVKTIVEKVKSKRRKKRKVVKQEEPEPEKPAEKEKAEVVSVVNSSNLKIKFLTDKSQQSSAPAQPLVEQPPVEKEKVEEEPEYEEVEEEVEVEKNGLMMVVLPPGLNVEWLGEINNLVSTATNDSKPLPIKRGKKRSYDTFTKGSVKLPSISTDSLQSAIKKIFKLTKALPNKPELLLNECDKLQSLVPIYGFEDIKKGLISRLKKARKKVTDANSKQAMILDSLVSQLEQNKTPIELPTLNTSSSAAHTSTPDRKPAAASAPSSSPTAAAESSHVTQAQPSTAQQNAAAQEEKPVKMSLSSLLS